MGNLSFSTYIIVPNTMNMMKLIISKTRTKVLSESATRVAQRTPNRVQFTSVAVALMLVALTPQLVTAGRISFKCSLYPRCRFTDKHPICAKNGWRTMRADQLKNKGCPLACPSGRLNGNIGRFRHKMVDGNLCPVGKCGSKLILTCARCDEAFKRYDCCRCKSSGKVCLKCDSSGATSSCTTCHKRKVVFGQGKDCPACNGSGYWISEGIESKGKRYCSIKCIPHYQKLKPVKETS